MITENWADRVATFIMMKLVGWPMLLTDRSPRRWLRVVGFFGFFLWMPIGLPLTIVAMPFALLDLFIQEVWKG